MTNLFIGRNGTPRAHEEREALLGYLQVSQRVDESRDTHFTCPLWRNCSLMQKILGQNNPLLATFKAPQGSVADIDLDLCTGSYVPQFPRCQIYQKSVQAVERMREEIKAATQERIERGYFWGHLRTEVDEAYQKVRERGDWKEGLWL